MTAESVSAESLALLRRTRSAMDQAQATWMLVSAHLTETYGLGPTDTINLETGLIARATPNAEPGP